MVAPEIKLMSMEERIDAACIDAANSAINRAEQTGTRIVISRDGKVVYLSPAEARQELQRNIESNQSKKKN